MGSDPSDTGGEAQRKDERDSLLVLAHLRAEGSADTAETVRVRNVSAGGLMAQTARDYPVGGRVEVEMDGVGPVVGIVAWAEAGRIGIAFDHPVDKSRARKQRGRDRDDMLVRPAGDFKRPPVKPR